MQNGYIESFNGRMRDELLNETLFFNLDQARQVIGDWVADYNIGQPHSSLNRPSRWARDWLRVPACCSNRTTRCIACRDF